MLQPSPEEEDLLRAPDGEGGDEERAPPPHRLVDRLGQLVRRGRGRVRTVAVCGLENQGVRLDRIVGIGQQRRPVSTQVA